MVRKSLSPTNTQAASSIGTVTHDSSGNLIGRSGVIDTEPALKERFIHVSKYWATPSPADEGPAIMSAMVDSRGKELYFHNILHRVITPISINGGGFKFLGGNGSHASVYGAQNAGTTIFVQSHSSI